jgi:lycopene cyclase domain-containing protein
VTYAWLSVVVLALIALVTIPTLRRLPARPLVLAGLCLLALTVVFDNIIVSVGLVAYDDDLILGARMPIAPIEDLAYAVAAILIIPAVWTWLAPRTSANDEARDA